MAKCKYTVTDIQQVLARFLVADAEERTLDAAALEAEIDAGLRNTPGVVITELPDEVPAPAVAAAARAFSQKKDAGE